MHIVSTILTVLLVLLSIGMVTIVTMQTPKSEGFGGGVANAPSSSFRGKAGYDEVLSGYTRLIGIGWFLTAFILAVVNEFATR